MYFCEIIHIMNIYSFLSFSLANQCRRFEIRLILRTPQIVESFVRVAVSQTFYEPFTSSSNQKVTGRRDWRATACRLVVITDRFHWQPHSRTTRRKINWSIIRNQISYTRAEFRKVRRAVEARYTTTLSYTWRGNSLLALLLAKASAKASDLELKEV